VPVLTHLHGTELKMLDAIARDSPDVGQGPHARWWASRAKAAALRATATITTSPYERGEAVRLLEVDPDTVHCLPNGVDTELFAPRRLSDDQRREQWLEWLVRDPQGWDEASGRAGSVRYSEEQVLDAFFDRATGERRPVLLFVGRFLGFKRLPLLVRAYARARSGMANPAPLVVWGGVPGEWEAEHPHTVAMREGVDGVFFSGWRGHDELPTGLGCADCFVAPSTDEPFGLVYLEAMACQLPVIATLSGGPPSFVNVIDDEPDGWLVPPDNVEALADAMATAVDDTADRDRRGANAANHARRWHSWDSAAGRLSDLYEACADPPGSAAPRSRTSR
jgi:glycosyltransferase involved in cell wall biosynthesis